MYGGLTGLSTYKVAIVGPDLIMRLCLDRIANQKSGLHRAISQVRAC
jgi:hypothetical protein